MHLLIEQILACLTVVSEIKFNKRRESTAGGALTFNRA